MMRCIAITVIFFFLSFHLFAQQFISIHTRWDDSFTEWEIITDLQKHHGYLTKRWQDMDDWSAWDYNLGDQHGDIQQVYERDPFFWELTGFTDRVTAKTRWQRDISQWRITDDTHNLLLEMAQPYNAFKWRVKSPDYGQFIMKMDWIGDPRDWKITDELSTEISADMKMMIIFIVVHHSTPKY